MTFRYDFAPTPFGDALAVFSDAGLVRFDLPESDFPATWLLDGASRALRSTPVAAPGDAAALNDLLDAYFDGEPVRFDEEIPLDWSLTDGFTRRALQEVCEIPWAETASYGEVAVLAGSPGAARAVGTACRLTPFSIVVPVHRVVRSDGSPGHYGAHPERKRYLLDLEADSARQRGIPASQR
ncbi:methylated-DNA-[protein]-cysteine S-methyltransferase [Microbacterium keratanolyticum]|uniref:Methylated-DNA--protein-cysteine methyltransferase n=1 Tax=Microbacterium keratanolyticum TaxID=67574 RepID=A0A9W6M947_9MICO|nr:methylated-DNA--[protein]-cysteine S-methyltransferase [Microbacterium keratanolyticum]MBM7469687.1 methylated-DNA-[protein]-cysteine S-methyltransferase [Microbacterium keratanolyticum]GLK01764.1 methylated-DNA--protein-cysteine methyltransferase [Microbacterium keratanolyticum]